MKTKRIYFIASSIFFLVTLFCFQSIAAAKIIPADSKKFLKDSLKDISIHSEYVDFGNVFNYEVVTPLVSRRVKVKAAGTTSGFAVNIGQHFAIEYDYLQYDVDGYFQEVQVSRNKVEANIFSVRGSCPEKQESSFSKIEKNFEYKLLNGSGISEIHFLNLSVAKNLGTVKGTLGITSYFGKGIDTEIGPYVKLSHLREGSGEIFLEYSAKDTTKVFQRYYVATCALNVGCINTNNFPEDVLSFGVKVNYSEKFSAYFKIYDVEMQMKPLIGVEIKK